MDAIFVRIAILATLLCCVGPAKAIETQRSDKMSLRYEMAVGVDGKATALKSLNTLPEAVDQKIQQRVRDFVFQPATINGVAQPATTTLYLTLGPIELANGTKGYSITSLSTGPRRLANQTWVDRAPRKSEGGYYLVGYNAEGRITDVELDEAHSPDLSPGFRKWARELMRSLRFQPETVAGKPVAAKVLVPVLYCKTDPGSCPALAPLSAADGNDLDGEMTAKSILGPPAKPEGAAALI